MLLTLLAAAAFAAPSTPRPLPRLPARSIPVGMPAAGAVVEPPQARAQAEGAVQPQAALQVFDKGLAASASPVSVAASIAAAPPAAAGAPLTAPPLRVKPYEGMSRGVFTKKSTVGHMLPGILGVAVFFGTAAGLPIPTPLAFFGGTALVFYSMYSSGSATFNQFIPLHPNNAKIIKAAAEPSRSLLDPAKLADKAYYNRLDQLQSLQRSNVEGNAELVRLMTDVAVAETMLSNGIEAVKIIGMAGGKEALAALDLLDRDLPKEYGPIIGLARMSAQAVAERIAKETVAGVAELAAEPGIQARAAKASAEAESAARRLAGGNWSSKLRAQSILEMKARLDAAVAAGNMDAAARALHELDRLLAEAR